MKMIYKIQLEKEPHLKFPYYFIYSKPKLFKFLPWKLMSGIFDTQEEAENRIKSMSKKKETIIIKIIEE